MSAPKPGWISLEEVINGYLDRSEQSIHKYSKCWHLAFDGMYKLGLDFFFAVKTVKLAVNPNFTANLPADYQNYSKVGYLNGNGEIVPMAYNGSLTTLGDLFPDRIARTAGEGVGLYDSYYWGSNVFYNYWGDGGYMNLYGIPSGPAYRGTFRIDSNNGVIVLSDSFVWPSLCMEYVASPAEDEVYYVPTVFKEALMWFIAWHDISMMPNTRKGSLGDKEQRKRNYYNERRLARASFKPLRLDQEYIWSVANQRECIKG